MIELTMLARSPMFAGLGTTELEVVGRRVRTRTFKPGQPLCEAGHASDRCWVLTAGLVDVLAAGGSGEVVARQRRGAGVGAVAVLLREPYSESVIASIPTAALECGAEELHELVGQFPQVIVNILRSLHTRLATGPAAGAAHSQGESVAIAVGASMRRVAGPLVAAARSASPRPVTALDRQFSFAGAVTAAGELASTHATVLLPAELELETVAALMREADRVVAIAGTAAEVAELEQLPSLPGAQAEVEMVLVGDDARRAGPAVTRATAARVIRLCEPARGLQLSERDLAWLGRHLTRTKLGVALGAGGAKGYAHIGVLQVLEEAGYAVDFVAGSSMGAIVGTYLALGADAPEIDRTLREAFDPPAVAEIFKTSLSGRATGLELMKSLMRETTAERTFAETVIPLTIMAVDLTQRAPAPLREGPIWEALLAATALAGVFAPYERAGHRLVDGLALVPVPTGALIQDGADVTVSVNLLGRETLPSWPGGPPPEPPPERRRRGVLDDLLEVMDLSQLTDSVHHAELADVAITPTFGPGEWRDFHLADQYLAAGRAAASEQLPALRALALPTTSENNPNHQGGDIGRADAVRI